MEYMQLVQHMLVEELLILPGREWMVQVGGSEVMEPHDGSMEHMDEECICKTPLGFELTMVRAFGHLVSWKLILQYNHHHFSIFLISASKLT